MDKHWIEFLPEVGNPIIAKANKQKQFKQRIADLHQEIEVISTHWVNQEVELLNEAAINWSSKEITQAKNQAISAINS